MYPTAPDASGHKLEAENILEIHRLEVMKEQKVRDENEVNSQRGETETMWHLWWRKREVANVILQFPKGLAVPPALHDTRLPYSLIIKPFQRS